MKYFVDTVETISEGVGFQLYGPLHLSWLLLLVVFAIYMSITYKKADAKKRDRIRKLFAGLIILDEIWKVFWLFVGGNYTWSYLPLHLCSINIFIIAYHVFKPNEMIDNFLYCGCLPGAIAALVAPTWTELPFLNFMHLHSFTIHILLAVYPIMLTVGGDIKPQLKQVPKAILFAFCMAVPIYFVNLALDTNFMFLMYAEPGNPLYYFEPLGSHLIGLPVIYAGVVLVLYGPLYLMRKKDSK